MFSATSIFINTAKGMEGSQFENILDVVVDNME
jgi:hypothetical protein